MGTVTADITMSLDGFVSGPDDNPEQGLGAGGEILHYWVFGGPWTYADFEEGGTAPDPANGHPVDKAIMDEANRLGAGVCGRRMYDLSKGWGGSSPFGGPCFVVTHRVEDQPDPSSNFVFVDSVEDAVAQAKERAGDATVGIGGGASIIRQALRAGLVDELRLHIAPVLLGAGVSLFGAFGTRIELEPVDASHSPYAAHLSYRVRK